MVEYTQEELWELAARMHDRRKDPAMDDLRGMHGIDAYGWILGSTHVYLSVEGKNIYLTSYDHIPGYIHLRYLLYTKPLEDMPLYINDPAYTCCIIATWRLAIAR